MSPLLLLDTSAEVWPLGNNWAELNYVKFCKNKEEMTAPAAN